MTSSMTVGLKLLYERDGEKVAFPIEEGETFIGRKDYCDICFPDGSVSKRHVRIVRTGSKVELFDAGSRNGTLVNGKVLEKSVFLRDGDVIQLGKIVLTVSGGETGSMKQESRGQKSRDSFRDFDDFDRSSGKSKKDEETGAYESVEEIVETELVASGDGAKGSSPSTKKVEPSGPPPSGNVEVSKASGEKLPKTRLIVVGGDGKGNVHELAGQEAITLGTKEENDIPLKGDGISRYHAQILFEKGAWVLKDLGSRNGTFVGDRRVDEHELAPGDVVMIGTVYLKFEQETAAPAAAKPFPEQAKELLELLKKDPKGFIQSSSGRRAIMIVLALLIALILLAPQGGGGADPNAQDKAAQSSDEATVLPHQIIELLQKEQAQKARDILARVRGGFKAGQDRPFLNDLDDLAKIWVDHNAPLTFEWKGAVPVLEKVQRNGRGELDKDCLDWLAKAQKEVEDEAPNAEAIFKGGAELTAALNCSRRGDTKEALARFKASCALFKKIPKKSVLFGPAQSQGEKARQALFKLLQREAERLASIDPPPWQDAIDRLNESVEYAASLEEKIPVRKKIEEYQANARDEEAFARAVDIVQGRRTDKYDEAIQLLSGISKASRVAGDAVTYLHWIQADRDVRNAKIAYDEGNWEKARGLLENALKVVELGPDARASVTRRIDLWSSVEASLREGLALSERGDDAAALAKLENVLKLEPNAKNRYHVLAEGEINVIHDRGDKWIDQKLSSGLEHLEKGRYKEAYDAFKFVVSHAKQDKVRRAKIEAAVQKANNEKRIYQDCYKRWLTNENAMFDGLLEKLLLIGSYLPIDDPERPKARDLYKKVKERLKVAMDQNKPDDDDQQQK